MALETELTKKSYNVSGGYLPTYEIPFPYWDEGDIKAVLTSSLGDETEIHEGTDFTVSTPGPSGTLTKLTTWWPADTLTIYRDRPLTQIDDFMNGDEIDADILETVLDRIVGMTQQLQEQVDRTLRVQISNEDAVTLELPDAATRAERFLAFDSNGQPIAVDAIDPSLVPITPYMVDVVQSADVLEAQKNLGIVDASDTEPVSAFVQGVLAADSALELQKAAGIVSSDAPAAIGEQAQHVLENGAGADAIPYDGTAVSLAATNVQDAIDEVVAEKQPIDATLSALAGLSTAADRLPYFTGADAAALATFTSFARTLIDDATAAAARATMGIITELARNYIDGLIMSNNGADANNDIDIAVGSAMDSTNAKLLVLGAAITKQLDAAWAAGTGNGGIDTGAKANSTWYAVHIIEKTADGTIDALFSLSPTAPTMPAGYGKFRRIGWIRTDSSGKILAFTQSGDYFSWSLIKTDVNALTNGLGTNRVLQVMTIPPDVLGQFNIGSSNGSATPFYMWVLASTTTDTPPSSSYYTHIADAGRTLTAEGLIKTDSSRRIAFRVSVSSAIVALIIRTIGWIDFRGKE